MSFELIQFSAGYDHWQTDPISFSIKTGSLAALLGPNGAGKSTLLKGIMGLIQQEGNILVQERSLAKRSAKERALDFSYLPQRFELTYATSIESIVLMGFNPEMSLFENYSTDQCREVSHMLKKLADADRRRRSISK